MNNKFLLYMMTGNIYFLFMSPMMAFLMQSMGGGANGTQLSTGGINPMILALAASSNGNKRRSYRRPVTRVIYRNSYRRRY